MPPLDDEIDALYAGPLAAFTPARNALAKRAGARAGDVRALVKPHVAAWAVNQLYWHRRALFDALVRASEDKRRAVVTELEGGTADVTAADARYRAALERATEAATALLREAGDAASPASRQAVRQTLEALPAPEANGRLTRPLASVGFSVLSSLMAGRPPAAPGRRPADVIVMPRRGPAAGAAGSEGARAGTPRGGTAAGAARTNARAAAAEARRAAAEARRAEAARRQARARVARERDRARARARETRQALTRARAALDAARTRVDALDAELSAARRDLGDRTEALDEARRAANDAAAELVALEREFERLGD